MAVDLWQEGVLPANNISIHYYRTVQPAELANPAAAALPILIWLHCLVASGATLIEPASGFIDEYDVILPDARGHGQSSPIPKGTFTMEWLVKDAIALIETLGGGQPVFLLGHSMGAATAARVAKARPDLIRALVLEEPPWGRVQGAVPDYAASQVVASTLPSPTRDLRNMTDAELWALDGAKQLELPPHAMSATQAQRAWDVDDCEETLAQLDMDDVEAVEGITVPVELQRGDPSADVPSFFASCLDPVVAQITLATFPRGIYRYFRDGSHLLHIDPVVGFWTLETKKFFRLYEKMTAAGK